MVSSPLRELCEATLSQLGKGIFVVVLKCNLTYKKNLFVTFIAFLACSHASYFKSLLKKCDTLFSVTFIHCLYGAKSLIISEN